MQPRSSWTRRGGPGLQVLARPRSRLAEGARYHDAVGEADDEAPLPEVVAADEVGEAVDEAELPGEDIPEEPVELGLEVAPPSAFCNTSLIVFLIIACVGISWNIHDLLYTKTMFSM